MTFFALCCGKRQRAHGKKRGKTMERATRPGPPGYERAERPGYERVSWPGYKRVARLGYANNTLQ